MRQIGSNLIFNSHSAAAHSQDLLPFVPSWPNHVEVPTGVYPLYPALGFQGRGRRCD